VLAPALLPRSWLQHQALLSLQQVQPLQFCKVLTCVNRPPLCIIHIYIPYIYIWTFDPCCDQLASLIVWTFPLQLHISVPLRTPGQRRNGQGNPLGQYQLTFVSDDVLIGRASQGSFVFLREEEQREGCRILYL